MRWSYHLNPHSEYLNMNIYLMLDDDMHDYLNSGSIKLFKTYLIRRSSKP